MPGEEWEQRLVAINWKNAFGNDPFSYFSTKAYVVCTQKNRLNETFFLSTQNIC